MAFDLPLLIRKVEQAAIDLERDGYAVITELFDKQECESIRQRMWNHWANLSDQQFTPDLNYANMYATQLPAHKHGILESYRLNHLDVIREIRRDPRLHWCYALLYGSDQLTASMDRVNFKFPGRPYHSQESWPHADQHPAKLGRVTIQSYLTLLECQEKSPGNRFYRGSHAIFDEFFKEKRDKMGQTDWNKLTEEEKVSLPKLCPLVKPTYPEGSLLLWDSRTVHDPDDGTDFKEGRFVVYLCYNKLWGAEDDSDFCVKKRNAFMACRASSHSPVPQTLFPKLPRTYGKEKGLFDEIPSEKLGLADPTKPQGVERLLYCFESYENKEGKLLGDPEWREKYGKSPLLEFVPPFMPKKQKARKTKVKKVETKKAKK
jgi:hypothetical protein